MLLRELIVLIICCFIYGCSDYPSGYKDGYGSIDKRQWIVFGSSEYLSGFEAGKAENFSDINHLQCPVVTILADPLMFLPTEYKRVAPDTYQLDFQ